MSIERFGDTRRNMMIPMYWRYVDQNSSGAGPITLSPIANTTSLATLTLTTTEVSHIKIAASVDLFALTAAAWCTGSIYVTLAGAVLWTAASSCYINLCSTNAAFTYVDESRAAGALTYILYGQSNTNSVAAYRPNIVIDIARA